MSYCFAVLRVAVLALVVTASSAARADDVVSYEVDGEADSAGADPRVAALDDAFSHAVQTALRDLVAGDIRAAHKADLDREVVGRSRLWVVKFTVGKDDTADGRRQLVVSVRIDRDKLRVRLGELGVPLIGASTNGPLRGVAVLLRVTQPDAVVATYGSTADPDAPGAPALATMLRSAGFTVRKASSSGPAARGAGELPLDDDEAAALATDAKADSAVVVGVTVGPATQVRGVATPAALVTAHVHLVDHGKPAGDGIAMAAALGDDLPHAIDRAVVAAATDVVPAAPASLDQAAAFTGEDTPIAAPGVVLVRMPARTPYALVLAEARYLAGARGVQAATLRRLSPKGWVIGVTTADGPDAVAQVAKKPPSG